MAIFNTSVHKKILLNARRRTQPLIHDFCYVHCRSHLLVLNTFRLHLLQTTPEPVVLDVGCGSKPFMKWFSPGQYIGIDIDPDSSADFVLDCNRDSFPMKNNTIDGVMLSNSLEHIFDTTHLLSEIFRVLKPGGLIYFSAPMTFPVHAHPDDYHRFTPYYFKRLFSDWELLELNGTNSVFSTPLLLSCQILETFFPTWLTCLPITILNATALFVDYSTKLVFTLLRVKVLRLIWSGCPLELNGIFRKPNLVNVN